MASELHNRWIDELVKFKGKSVLVVDVDGNTFKGTCKLINSQNMCVVLFTDSDKIIVRHWKFITRAREKDFVEGVGDKKVLRRRLKKVVKCEG